METLTPEQLAEKEAQKKAEAHGNQPVADDSPAQGFIAKFLGQDAAKEKEAKPKPAKKKVAKQPDEGGDGAGGDNDGDGQPSGEHRAAVASFDEEKLGRSIAETLAPHLKPKQDEASGGKKADEEADPKEKRRLEVLFHMEQMPEFSGKYKGIVERYKETKKAALAEGLEYKKQWEAEHPGQKFDEDDEEHAEALDAIDAKIEYPDDDDFDEAKADFIAEKRVAEKAKKIDARVEDVERVERARKEEPKVRSTAESAGNDFWKSLGDDFSDVVTETGAINEEKLKEIKESDPVKYDIAVSTAQAVEVGAAVIYRLANGLEKYDPDNDTHRFINNFAIDRERKMLARPADKQRDDNGRKFVSSADYNKMSAAEQKKHWTFSADDLVYLHTRANVTLAQQQLEKEEEKFRSRAIARGLLKSDAAPEKQVQVAPDDDDEDESLQGGKPLSPSSTAAPKSAAGKGGKGGGPQSNAERFLAKL